MAKKKWFDVTVKEEYHHTYKVLATDESEADDLVNEMVNNGDVDPTQDGNQSYDRETDVEAGEEPASGEEYWQFGEDGPEAFKTLKTSKKRKAGR